MKQRARKGLCTLVKTMNPFIQSSATGNCEHGVNSGVSRMTSVATRVFGFALAVIVLAVSAVSMADETGIAAFEGHVVLEAVGDDPFVPSFRLGEQLVFRQGNGTEWVSPSGAILDGRSVPSLFVKVIGHPFDGTFRKSAVSYDYAVKSKQHSWETAQRMFYEALLVEGVPESDAKVMYLLLSGSGTRWALPGPNSCFSRCHTDAKELEWRPRVDNEKLLALIAWAQADNPELDQIDQRARATILEPGPHIFGVME